MRRGEVRWYRFGRPDKRRPVLLIARDFAYEVLSEVIVAPIISTIRDIPSEVYLTEADGMKTDCVVKLDYIQTVSKGRIGPLITMLSEEKMSEVAEAARFALGI